ncbi:Fructosamine kinase-domain-containing protein [Rhypophila decipiens]|uniref:protein-ribulosamine 3-kinase n=1 Tax=Rhypophila decipiens TaxID=261697 RepID=A0AAN6XTR0_9PEZI|nr:Fructosamine kinase-domain-containing protein [Rhypophila decipiens]
MASDLMRLDPNVLAALPNVVDVLNVQEVARSKWAKGMRVTARNADGTEDVYFMKISQGDLGKNAIMGEFEGTSAIHAVTPEFCPKPITWGTFKHDNDTHFYLCTFYDFAEDIMPHPESFCADLARLHTQSKSPAGKFGFHCTTYNGDLPQDNIWSDSWEDFFATGTRQALKVRDERAGSKSKELEALLSAFFDKVIPRLLKPLDITPALIHRDLWYGNVSVVEGTNDKAIVYDPAAFYGHNELQTNSEIGDQRATDSPRSSLMPSIRVFPSRIRWMTMTIVSSSTRLLRRFNLNAAALLPNQPRYLQMVVDAIMELNTTFTGCEMHDSHEIDPGQGK